MPRKIDRVGVKRNRLTIVRQAESRGGRVYWLAVCDCGSEVEVSASNFTTGAVMSCGCLQKEQARIHRTVHGASRDDPTGLYSIWESMRKRCSNPLCKDYARYGGRGIRVCSRWNDFAAFVSDMGPRPSRLHSLDRKDGNRDYEPSNCRWSTHSEQALNRAGQSLWVPVVVGGVSYPSMSRAAASLGVSVYRVKRLAGLA